MKRTFRKWIALAVVVTTTHLGFVSATQAALVGTEAARSTGASVGASDARARVESFLARGDVADQLSRLGISADEARSRVATMSDDELATVAQRIDQVPAGGDALGTIVGAAVLVFIVLLVTDILGLTKVFSFTRPLQR